MRIEQRDTKGRGGEKKGSGVRGAGYTLCGLLVER